MALELLDEDVRPELREGVARDIEELDGLIGELLIASRTESADAIERAEPLDLLALAREEGARAGVLVGGDPVEIHGDERLLRRFLRNLLDNAAHHAEGAEIGVEVRRAGAPDGALLRVSDRGPGLTLEERARVFEPFYRANSAGGQGSGLGLTIVRRVARLHGGEARCLERSSAREGHDVRGAPRGHIAASGGCDIDPLARWREVWEMGSDALDAENDARKVLPLATPHKSQTRPQRHRGTEAQRNSKPSALGVFGAVLGS